MTTERPIRRALISVYDKTGIVDFARVLHDEFGVELISTGGTARVLQEAGLPVTMVEQVTGFPEMMDGRVKTLHPKIHAAILADRDNPEHMRQLAAQGIEPIDVVVVNLYPFEQTVAQPDCTFEQAIEMIDIGGPCLLRAAAKNHRHVYVVQNVRHARAWFSGELPGVSEHDFRHWAAFNAFRNVAAYNASIARWLSEQAGADALPRFGALHLLEVHRTRYGENPHQQAGMHIIYGRRKHEASVGEPDCAEAEMSYNNYADASAALELCAELTRAGEGMWHRFETGAPEDSPPARKLINDEHLTRRNLPHIQRPGATYFVTFRLQHGALTPTERTIVLQACTHWHGQKMTLHTATVMPDHVHLLLTPHEAREGAAIPLSEILHSIKRHAARAVNKARGRMGPVWMDESFDRVVRNEQEFAEKGDYIEANPVTAGLVDSAREWQWFWRSDAEFMEQVRRPQHRLQTGATGGGDPQHRLQTGATIQRVAAIPTACFIKHTNACGSAVHADPVEAYRRAYLGDPNAAMGGILAVNFPVDAAFAEVVMETYARFGKPLKEAGHPNPPGAFFVEVWIAPQFDEDAVRIIRGEVDGKPQKPWGRRVRLLAVGDMAGAPDADEMDLKRIAGGVLMQTRDLVGLDEDQWQVVTERQPSAQELDDLRLAWLVCKHTKSNAITICKDGSLLGSGAGQMSRVMSCRIATWLAQENGHDPHGAVAASDAFFPFRDGPDILADAGVTAIIQPGGSKRDDDTIAACNERGVAMILTGTRHFRH
jgi:AICAR transformylase/IMP cyclohydrolase PurH/REP element-mobilizing transposase RayT